MIEVATDKGYVAFGARTIYVASPASFRVDSTMQGEVSGTEYNYSPEDRLDESGDVPLYVTETSYLWIDTGMIYVDAAKYPVLKLVYEGGSENVVVSIGKNSVELGAAETSEGRVLIADLSGIAKVGSNSEIRLTFAEDAEIKIPYLAFCADTNIADSLNVTVLKDEIARDPMKGVEIKNADETVFARIDSEVEKRIEEIQAAESIDPKTVTGTCYYVSSIHGDDKNDGLSPETPWKSPKMLFRWLPNDLGYNDKLKKGDAVFFERGSFFYSDMHTNSGGDFCFSTVPGVTYSAYGTGPKPVFSGAVDIGSATGTWSATDTPNVWVLDTVIKVPKGKRRGFYEIGNFVLERDGDFTFCIPVNPYVGGNNKQTEEENFPIDTDLSRLKENNQGFHDLDSGKFYLYCDGGNPGEYYDDIKLSREGVVIRYICSDSIDTPTVLDNLAVKYSGRHGITNGTHEKASWAHELYFRNCEVAFVGNRYLGDGIENYGSCDGFYVTNCYVHDCVDDCLTSQCSTDAEGGAPGCDMNNVRFTNNVLTDTDNGIELWNFTRAKTSDSEYKGREFCTALTHNVDISGNYFVYVNWDCMLGGFPDQQFVNAKVHDNVTAYSLTGPNGEHPHTGHGPVSTALKGYEYYNNTYVVRSDGYAIRSSFFDLLNGSEFPYTERGIAFCEMYGINVGSTYYSYDKMSHWSQVRHFYTTRWENNKGY